MLPLLLLLLLPSTTRALNILSPNSIWVMDASLTNFTPHGVDWFDPIASPINLAMRDLKRDWQKVLGVPPSVLPSLPQGTWDGDCIVYFALAAPGQHEESFTVAASQAPGSNACLLTVTGGGIRGLIYGIFQVGCGILQGLHLSSPSLSHTSTHSLSLSPLPKFGVSAGERRLPGRGPHVVVQ